MDEIQEKIDYYICSGECGICDRSCEAEAELLLQLEQEKFKFNNQNSDKK
jgi:Pyruvate/2-oxoacid:ferredoxin oxidoreductase delta subunit